MLWGSLKNLIFSGGAGGSRKTNIEREISLKHWGGVLDSLQI